MDNGSNPSQAADLGKVIQYNDQRLFQFAASDSFDYKALKQSIADKKITTLDQLLTFFSKEEQLKPYLEHFTLMHTSQSSQKTAVSPDFPRVILHKPDGRLILAFTGNPEFLKQFNQLEVIEIPKDSAQPKFHRIEFQSGGKVPVSVDSPSNCQGCHGNPPRFIWGTYHLWPGAVAGLDDNQDSSIGPEDEKLKHFWKNNLKKQPYAHLKTPENLTLSKPFGSRRNLMLNSYLNVLNYRRIADLLVSSPLWAKYKFALYAAVLGCNIPVSCPLPHRRPTLRNLKKLLPN